MQRQDICEQKESTVEKLHEHLEFLNGKERPCARKLAKLTGYIISMFLALGLLHGYTQGCCI